MDAYNFSIRNDKQTCEFWVILKKHCEIYELDTNWKTFPIHIVNSRRIQHLPPCPLCITAISKRHFRIFDVPQTPTGPIFSIPFQLFNKPSETILQKLLKVSLWLPPNTSYILLLKNAHTVLVREVTPLSRAIKWVRSWG